ncbi:MAG: RdgB/HAM1 family non-canonical purine NTP pyrophosphatase [archaeon]|nr:RdgB/HAM1 family non-canonical purine NTP pyrophosphatase [archaeon]
MRLKVITSNRGKVKEYQELFKGSNVSIEHFSVSYDEIQSYWLEDVVKKGISDLRAKGLTDFLIDDSGMFIDALNGFPGVYSAYVQKTIGNKGILRLMENVENRRASFGCSIGCYIGKETFIVTGKCSGFIFQTEKGTGGFGYDPIFSPDGKKSFAEMSVGEKNVVSHRGSAVKLLSKELIDREILNVKN